MSKPDGTDPRILAPSEDEPLVTVKSAFGGNGKAYHTTECVNVRSMRQTREVKLSVAEWKGYHECRLCLDKKENGPYPEPEEQQSQREEPHTSPTRAECATFREWIGEESLTMSQAAARSDWGRTAVNNHASGDCSHDIDTPPVAFGWYYDAEQADTPGVRDEINKHISMDECEALRADLVSGERLRNLTDKYGLGKDGIRYHALGRCAHDMDVPALSHGWHYE